jgi:hypothetical protein
MPVLSPRNDRNGMSPGSRRIALVLPGDGCTIILFLHSLRYRRFAPVLTVAPALHGDPCSIVLAIVACAGMHAYTGGYGYG